MISLQKMTAEYVDYEDRIALTGDAGEAGLVRLWLIRPLAQKLISALIDIVKSQEGFPHADDIEAFKQAVAEQQRQPVPPVKYITSDIGKAISRAANPDGLKSLPNGKDWLVREMNIKVLKDGVALTFAGGDEQKARSGFSEELLRQWLGIMRNVCITADWVVPDWPEWMKAPGTKSESALPN